jgi:hypothetical protein
MTYLGVWRVPTAVRGCEAPLSGGCALISVRRVVFGFFERIEPKQTDTARYLFD